jgi:drug/metabolite transporter (DMT)-like permease
LLLAPIFSILISLILLREPLRITSVFAIVISLSGGLVVIQPWSAQYGQILYLPMAASLCVAGATVCNRILCASNNNWAILFSSGLLILLVILLPVHLTWKTTNLPSTALLLSLGAAGAASSYCHLHAYRYMPVTFLAPFDYLEWLFTAMLGWIVWAEIPQPASWLGCAGIVAGTAVALRARISAGAAAP